MLKHLGCVGAWIWAAAAVAQGVSPSASGSLELTVRSRVEFAVTVRITLTVSGTQPKPTVLEKQVDVPGKLAVEVPRGATVEARLAAPNLWAPAASAYVGKEGESLTFDLLPTGRLVADVTTDMPRLPDSLEARFAWAPDAENAVPGEHVVECPIVEKQVVCELPAGRLDLRLRRRGLVTLFRWNVEIPPHEEHPAPPVHLRPGATVFGWIASASKEFRPEKARAELVVDGVVPRFDAADRSRRESMHLQARVNPRGFYVFPDVPAGSYELVLRHDGLAPGRLEPVNVREGVELELPFVELEPPAELTLSVWPPRDPFHVPWRIEVQRRGPLSSRTVAEGSLDGEGSFQAESLESGEHRIVVIDSRGSRWHAETVQVTGAGGAYAIEMPYDRLEGLVTLAGEPLISTLYFGGRNGAERIVIDTNDEGVFYVFLPRRESWFADVRSLEPEVWARVEGIVVDRQPDEPWAKTVVEVPDTRVFGRVVDEQGRPAAGARVHGYGPEPETGRYQETRQVTSDADGRFELRGFQPGVWGLEAKYRSDRTGPSASAPWRDVEVEEGAPAGPVRLVVRQDEILSGIVVAPNGDGVPGAMVVPALEQGATPVSWDIQHDVTEVDGTFTFRIPSSIDAVQLQVYPPGHTARHLRVVLPTEDPVIVPVDAVGGRIVLRPQNPEVLEDRGFHIRTALFGEFLFYTPALRVWAASWGIRETENLLVFPSMEPGPYTACFDVTSLAIGAGRLPPGVEDRCVSGILTPGGELQLDVPNPRRSHSGESSQSPS